MRSYDVATREAKGEPVQFEIGYIGLDGEGIPVRKREVFTANGEVSPLMISEFSRNAEMDVTDPAAMSLLAQFFMEAFGDDAEYRRFFKFRNQHRVPDDQVMQIIADLIEDLTGRPTVLPSSSQDGQSTSGPTSRGGYSQPAITPDSIHGSVLQQRFTVIEGFDELEASSA